MTSKSAIYIDCSENMRRLLSDYPDELTRDVELHFGDPGAGELAGLVRGRRGVLNGHTVMDRAVLEAGAESLKTVVFLGTGASNYVDEAAAAEFGIMVRVIKNYGDRSIAEAAFALLLAGARDLGRMDRDLRAGVWESREGVELEGKTLGIVGTGGVGGELARMAHGFGMQVIAWNRSGVDPALPCREVALDDLFGTADAISLHVAYAAETSEMIGAELLSTVKPGAILVNTARGGIVDEAALVAALRTGPLGHAALDVYTEEPLPADSPFRDLPNVTLAAHAAWKTPEAADRLMRRGLEILQADLREL
jgi:D-3-phosphoglycerate dehydrogenase